MLARVHYPNQQRPPLKSSCYVWCRPNYWLSVSFHILALLHSMVRGWLLDPVKTAATTLAIQYWSDTNSDIRWTVRKYSRMTAAAAWVVGGLSCDHPCSSGRRLLRLNSASVLLPSVRVAITPWYKGCWPCNLWCCYSVYVFCRL